jgi:hypothetical protein
MTDVQSIASGAAVLGDGCLAVNGDISSCTSGDLYFRRNMSIMGHNPGSALQLN